MKRTSVLVFLIVIVGGALWAGPCLCHNGDIQKNAGFDVVRGTFTGQTVGSATEDISTVATDGAFVDPTARNIVEQAGTHMRLAQAVSSASQGYGTPQGYGTLPEGWGTLPKGYGTLPEGWGTPPQGYGTLSRGSSTPQGYGIAPQGSGTPQGSSTVPKGSGTPH